MKIVYWLFCSSLGAIKRLFCVFRILILRLIKKYLEKFKNFSTFLKMLSRGVFKLLTLFLIAKLKPMKNFMSAL